MERKQILANQKGFTLVEIIAVLILLGILAAVAIPRYMDMTTEARQKAIDAGIAEMNSRESMVWGKVKLSATPANDAAMDAAVLAHADYSSNLGADYSWSAGPTAAGGTLSFQSATGVALTRTAATLISPASWRR
ncbi:MAG: type II secretion system protein [Thermodesulfobacteriota bacterium]